MDVDVLGELAARDPPECAYVRPPWRPSAMAPAPFRTFSPPSSASGSVHSPVAGTQRWPSASGGAFPAAGLRNAGVDTWWPVLGAPASRCSVPCASSGDDHVGLANRLPRRPHPHPAENLSRRGKVEQLAVRCISKAEGSLV